jgi:hypothetical protein
LDSQKITQKQVILKINRILGKEKRKNTPAAGRQKTQIKPDFSNS